MTTLLLDSASRLAFVDADEEPDTNKRRAGAADMYMRESDGRWKGGSLRRATGAPRANGAGIMGPRE